MKRKTCPGCGQTFTKGVEARVLAGGELIGPAPVCLDCVKGGLLILGVSGGMQTRAVLAPHVKAIRKLALAYPESERGEGLRQAADILEAGRWVKEEAPAPVVHRDLKPANLLVVGTVPKVPFIDDASAAGPGVALFDAATGKRLKSGKSSAARKMPALLGAHPPKSVGKMLGALKQWAKPATPEQLAFLAGYRLTSGGFKGSLAMMRANGWITLGRSIALTDDGRSIAPDVAPFPKGPKLLEFWCEEVGPCGAALLQNIVGAYPKAAFVEDLVQDTGYRSTSGGFKAALAVLRKLDIIDGMRAKDDFMATIAEKR